jgi:uncharacterized protein (TIGR02246 family)
MSVSDQRAIEAIRQEFLEAYKAGDAARLGACFSDDAVQLPPNEPVVRGRHAIVSRYSAQFDQFVCELTAATEEIEISGPLAFAWGAYRIVLSPRSGSASIHDDGKYLAVFKRQKDGAWKFARDTFSSDNPASAKAES